MLIVDGEAANRALVVSPNPESRTTLWKTMRGRAIAGGSMGVLGMQERATLIQGKLDIHSEAGRGSTVMLRCPLRIRE
jgi:hypothetical protein